LAPETLVLKVHLVSFAARDHDVGGVVKLFQKFGANLLHESATFNSGKKQVQLRRSCKTSGLGCKSEDKKCLIIDWKTAKPFSSTAVRQPTIRQMKLLPFFLFFVIYSNCANY
jgi:hypothetical protein